MNFEEIKENLIKELDKIKDQLIDLQIKNNIDPNEKIGNSIVRLKVVIDIVNNKK